MTNKDTTYSKSYRPTNHNNSSGPSPPPRPQEALSSQTPSTPSVPSFPLMHPRQSQPQSFPLLSAQGLHSQIHLG